MANRFVNPFPQFFDSTPEALVGAKLFFYQTGTATKLNTYSRSTLTGPANANPVVLNAAGFPPVNIFLQNLAYRVVLAPATDTDPPTSPIWVADPVYTSDFSTVARVQTFPGNPNGFVAGTAGSGSTPADEIFDTVNNVLYIATTTGDAITTVWTAINASLTANVPAPQGRLTPTIGVPVILADAISVGAVFYEPYHGNLVPIYNGSVFTAQATPNNLGLALAAAHTAATIFDCFIFMTGSGPTLGTGPAWNNSGPATGSRGAGAGTTQLTLLNGILVNAVQITARNGANTFVVPANFGTYVGSILIDAGAPGLVTCHISAGQNRRWGVWNYYNRKTIILKISDGTASWNYNINTPRQSNAAVGNKLTLFSGVAEELFDIDHRQKVKVAAAAGVTTEIAATIGIGINTVAAFTLSTVHSIDRTGTGLQATDVPSLRFIKPPTIGINEVNTMEQGAGGETQTFFGSESTMACCAKWGG